MSITKLNDNEISVPVTPETYSEPYMVQKINELSQAVIDAQAFLADRQAELAKWEGYLTTAYALGVQAGGAQVQYVPKSISKYQMSMALLQLNWWSDVQALLNAQGNEALRIAFDATITFGRQDPLLLGAAQALSKSSEDLDDLFILGATLT